MDAPPSPEQPARNWSELPLEPLHSVFSKLGVVDLLMGAGLVCHSWLEEAKQPDLWRSVHTRHHPKVLDMNAVDLREMLKAAVDRSAGGMEVFVGDWFLTDNLLKYIGDRSPSLKVLDLVECSNISYEGLAEVIPRFPLLDGIVLSGYKELGYKYMGRDVYQIIGKTCTQLRRLELHHGSREQALGIAALEGLRDLALVGCAIDDGDLAVIVDSCPQLERLHVTGCFKIVGNTVLRAKCARIKERAAMPIELPRGLPFAVDTWTPASALKRHRFLTHAHRDHLVGITTTSAAGAVYASRLTVLIARHIFPQLGPDAFLEIELGAPVLVQDPDGDFTVTAFDANHCPGAVMFLFEGAFGNVLHTGDCRLTPDCIQGLPLGYITVEGSGASQAPPSCRIDYLFLDCTFAKCSLQFPTKEASIRQVINCIWEHPNAPTVYLVSDMLGQEDILIEVSRAFGSKIYVNRDKSPDCYHNLSLVAPEILTEDTSSRFQVMEFPRLSEQATEMLALARAKQQPEPLIIRPSSQWYAHYAPQEASLKQKLVLTEPMRDEFGVWHVCLSMHSSREELEEALRFLQPKWVISTTPPCLAMDLSYVKKHCFMSKLGPDDPIWKLLGIPHGNSTVVGSQQTAPTALEAMKQSEEEYTCSAVCSQVLQNEESVVEDFAIEVAPPVTLFGRARFGLPQDCELWKDAYGSVQVDEQVKFEEELHSSYTKSFELWKDVKPDKGMIDSTQAVTKELHASAIEPELQKDCGSIDGSEVIDIAEGEVQEQSSSTEGCAELVEDVKCSQSAERVREARFVSREAISIARAKLWDVCKTRNSAGFIVEAVGKEDKVELTEKLPSEDRIVLADISNRSEGPGTDGADTAGVGSSKVLNVKLRRLYRSMNVAVPRPLPSLVELMGDSKRPRVSSQTLHLR
ncbi:uncharacterized protein LOC124655877 [Lolium rigidum]|uniref:uncharacterized protein LOC124655877 n=1 Tax=Lolium rigidum TaxID=89674 RepID=UPI001F5CA234|nr:uncharacterized protein LOC124655877 [Lolium rigidum]